MKRAGVVLIAAVLAACGGGGGSDDKAVSATPPAGAPVPSPSPVPSSRPTPVPAPTPASPSPTQMIDGLIVSRSLADHRYDSLPSYSGIEAGSRSEALFIQRTEATPYQAPTFYAFTTGGEATQGVAWEIGVSGDGSNTTYAQYARIGERLLSSGAPFAIRQSELYPLEEPLATWSDEYGNALTIVLHRGDHEGEAKVCWEISTSTVKRLACSVHNVSTGAFVGVFIVDNYRLTNHQRVFWPQRSSAPGAATQRLITGEVLARSMGYPLNRFGPTPAMNAFERGTAQEMVVSQSTWARTEGNDRVGRGYSFMTSSPGLAAAGLAVGVDSLATEPDAWTFDATLSSGELTLSATPLVVRYTDRFVVGQPVHTWTSGNYSVALRVYESDRVDEVRICWDMIVPDVTRLMCTVVGESAGELLGTFAVENYRLPGQERVFWPNR